MYPVAVPAVVVKTPSGQILAAMPLKPVPVATCGHWNALVGGHCEFRKARHG